MADYGCEIRNSDSGIIQVSQDFNNLAFREKKVVRTASSKDGQYTYHLGYWLARVYVNRSSRTVVAFRCSDYCFIYLYDGNYVIFGSKNKSERIEVFVFDRVSDAKRFDNSNYGLKVQKANGDVAFDSRYRYMKVVGAMSTSDDVPDYIASRDDLAVVQNFAFESVNSVDIVRQGSPPTYIRTDVHLNFWGFKSSGSGTDFKLIKWVEQGGGKVGSFRGPGDNILFLDVDGLS